MAQPSNRARHSSSDEEFIDDGVVAEINITPLTDIFLVLLIIFMVTSSAIVEAGGSHSSVSVNLPGGGAGSEEIASQDELIVAILEDGRIILDGEEMSLEALSQALLQSVESSVNASDRTLVIQADRGVQHGRVVEVMELARSKGLVNLAIATQTEADD